jgi:hypothetical protein
MTTRRQFLSTVAALPICALAATEKARHKIRDVRTMTLKGPSRTYVLVKIIADDGTYGIAEAYGTPAIGVKEQILSLKPWLTGKDPLEIDTLFAFLGERTPDLSGTRTDGSAHELMRAASGIEMALWDLAGKLLFAFTITPLRRTCSIRHRAAIGRRRSRPIQRGSQRTNSDSPTQATAVCWGRAS